MPDLELTWMLDTDTHELSIRFQCPTCGTFNKAEIVRGRVRLMCSKDSFYLYARIAPLT